MLWCCWPTGQGRPYDAPTPVGNRTKARFLDLWRHMAGILELRTGIQRLTFIPCNRAKIVKKCTRYTFFSVFRSSRPHRQLTKPLISLGNLRLEPTGIEPATPSLQNTLCCFWQFLESTAKSHNRLYFTGVYANVKVSFRVTLSHKFSFNWCSTPFTQ
jgi:hypothetical protein